MVALAGPGPLDDEAYCRRGYSWQSARVGVSVGVETLNLKP